MITVRHPRFKFDLKKNKFYQIIELDPLRNKKVYSAIFKGIDYLNHLPPKPQKNSWPIYEIQRIRCVPGTHTFKNMKEKIQSLADLLQLPYDMVSIQVKNMENAGYDEKEVIIILTHFMSGGMLSEIIAPPQKAKINDPVISLQEFDVFFSNRRNEIPGLADQLIEKWARNHSNQTS